MNNLLEFLPGPNPLKNGDYTYYTGQDLIELDLPERGHLLPPWLSEQSISMVFANRGVGKTFFALNVAYAVATGSEYLGWKADKPRSVLYLDGEMAASDMKTRIKSIYDSNPTAGYPQLYILTPDIQKGAPMPDLGTIMGQKAIHEMCSQADLIIVDNIATLCRSGSENETQGWKPMQTWALNLRASGKSVLFVHHAGKGGGQRGASSREDVMDTVIELKHPKDYSPEQGAHFEIHFKKHRSFFGDDAQSLEVSLETSEDDNVSWEVKKVSESTYDRVIDLFKTGISQAEVAKELDINKSTVSRHIQTAKAEGRLPSKKASSQSGSESSHAPTDEDNAVTNEATSLGSSSEEPYNSSETQSELH